MVSLAVILAVCAAHFIADFVLQARWMAVNKSSNLGALSLHIAQYSLVIAGLLWPTLVWLGYEPNGTFALWIVVNAGAHFVVDFVSSRLAKAAMEKNNQKLFWSTIGADQFAHQVCLFGTYVLLGM